MLMRIFYETTAPECDTVIEDGVYLTALVNSPAELLKMTQKYLCVSADGFKKTKFPNMWQLKQVDWDESEEVWVTYFVLADNPTEQEIKEINQLLTGEQK